MHLEAEASYRAVFLCRITGPTTMPVQEYTKADGTVIPYHRSFAYGPYSTPSAAKASVKREGNYLSNYSYDEVDAFMEKATTVWEEV